MRGNKKVHTEIVCTESPLGGSAPPRPVLIDIHTNKNPWLSTRDSMVTLNKDVILCHQLQLPNIHLSVIR